jgi:DNA polymerase (family 10)
MTNQEIAEVFELLAQVMDIHGENSFKTKTYSTAAYRIEKLGTPISEMLPEQIRSISGIGDAVSQKILELVQTGKLQVLEDYLAQTPAGVLDMLKIKGLGPKKIALLWKELQIESLGELEYACNENRLLSLKGFGAKTQLSILNNLAFLQANKGFYLWAEAEAVAEQISAILLKAAPQALIAYTGAYYRLLPTLTTIHWVTTLDIEALSSILESLNTLTVTSANNNTVMATGEGVPRLEFQCVSIDDFYTTQFKQSGSEAFIAAFEQQYTIPPQAASEQAIFEHNHIQYIPSALREVATILARAQQNTIPNLIIPSDVKGVIHSHSTWSDGVNTLEEMAVAARDKGYEYLVISDHSQAAFYANGLTPERIMAQHQEIDQLNARLAPFKIFKSIEADILYDGQLDYTPEVLQQFDMVIASVHSNLKMNESKAMERLLTAIANPYTTILGHPTGRLLLSREGYPVDHKVLIDACVQHGVVIEINAHPKRLDLDWTWIDYAIQQGAMLSINPDAHSIKGIDMITYGVWAAQKGGVNVSRNFSSLSLSAMEQYIAQRKAH